jgi:hypothetical protein
LQTGGANDPALPSDIAEAKHIIHGASIEWLVEQLPGLNEEEVAEIVLKVRELPEHPLP